ncbi:DUF6434 domain-containing protein [Microterricola pindariensis]|uniref:DUF6434 domain-containing protein n=1 Tax=Microterricola pindariensis TaxID=478010 RepID=A0ABX5ARG2_9MICO|nr:DUF6434 domain-containing protein [Microterricola pindariensis]PPL14743.1 hypothetical protein GY24_15600 [Microterricola pindariensis]
MPDDLRPSLSPDLSGFELLRWYWLKDELSAFARMLGIRSTGGKELLTRRIAAALDGQPFAEPGPRRGGGTAQLSGALTAATPIPRGQRCSQPVRAWFAEQLGGPFRFDGAMRAFFAETDGTQTLRDALAHYRATRGRGPQEIDAQFEYNRFTRGWHESHPGGSREELLRAWQAYRGRPADERGRA